MFEDHDGQWRPLSGNDSSMLLVKKKNKSASYDWGRGEARWSGDVKPDRSGPVDAAGGRPRRDAGQPRDRRATWPPASR